MALADYNITEKIGENRNSIFFRARQSETHSPVILKVLRGREPSPEQSAWFCQEYARLQQLSIAGVIPAHALQWNIQQPFMVLQDMGGYSHSLATWQAMGCKLKLTDFLAIALSLTRIVERLHQAKLVHKDINPSNFLLNPITWDLQLIDLTLASQANAEMTAQTWEGMTRLSRSGNFHRIDANFSTGFAHHLAYISPEQTGRMYQSIDARTDFYSLGITLYELLSGAPPFQGSDILEVIHGHIARPVPNLDEATSRIDGQSVPAQVRAIIMKLLEKEPNARYQSAHGLVNDLERCYSEAKERGQISAFALASQDYNGVLTLPDTLVGRQQEMRQLLDLLDHSHQGKSELVLLSGEAGIGKSVLVQQLKPAIATQRGLFLAGKYDQYQCDSPYSGIDQALNQFCEQLLTRENAELDQWKDRLLQGIGGNYQLLTDIIPQLALVIGQHAPIAVENFQDNTNRIQLLLDRFLTSISETYRPLVIFLDDLHWADLASIQLLHHWIHKNHFENLLIIGTYRPQEVLAVDPLAELLGTLRQHHQLHEIELRPLAVEDVNSLLVQTLAVASSRTTPLAELIHRKTDGNPFFVLEFLKSLYGEELLVYQHSKSSENGLAGQWEWDLTRILAKNTTQNVVELMLDKIHQLPPATRDVLQLAACLGNSFSLAELAIAQSISLGQALKTLWPSIQAGLIAPLNDQYRLYLNSPLVRLLTENKAPLPPAIQKQLLFLEKTARSALFQFQHDRVQEAVYSNIAPSHQAALHHQIGQGFLQHYSLTERTTHILKIVNHCNQGLSQLTPAPAKLELAQLNLEAGQKATQNAAHQTACHYFEQGIILCGKDIASVWENHYELALALHNGAHRAAGLTGQFERQKVLGDRIEAHTQTWQDRIEVTEAKIHACIAQRQFAEAIALALAFVRPLGTQFPDNPQPQDFQTELVKTLSGLQGNSALSLLDHPPMEVPEALATLRILYNVHTALYMVAPALFPLAIFKEVQLSLEYGNGPLSAPAYVYFGLILCGIVGDIDQGYMFGQLAKQLVDQPQSKNTRAATLLTMAGATAHWQEPIRNTLPIYQDGHRSGVKTGDFQSAAFCLELHCAHSFLMGMPLSRLTRTVDHSVKAIAQLHQASPLQITQAYQQIIVNLNTAHTPIPWEISGDICQEESLISTLEQAQNLSSLGHVYINKLMLCYWFGQYSQAEALIPLAALYVEALPGTIMVPIYTFYATLTLLAQYPEKEGEDRQNILEQVEINLDKLLTWSKFSPLNYAHKWSLAEAERLRVLNRPWEAMQLYEQAIQGARKNGFLNEEAIACEQAACLHQDHGQADLADYHIQQAHSTCQRWQAFAKARQLEQKYLSLSAVVTTSSMAEVPAPPPKEAISQSLDLASILKATQVLASEIELGSLLSHLMTIVLENAGAQTGCLVLLHQGEKAIFAKGAVGQGVHVFANSPLPLPPKGLPMQVINYVFRLRKSVVLDRASTSGDFTQDPYIAQHNSQSILCMPLMNQTQIVGLLYLENSLTPAIFSADRLEVLNILCSQAAVSIEKAQLYEQLKQHSLTLEQKVAERTQELSQANQELQRLATLDSLTQIANRRRFDEYLDQEYWRSQRDQTPLCVILCDVDHFKLFNDHYGHQAGDECLKQVAKALSQSVKRSVDLVTRYGGEEFAIILPNTQLEGAIAVAAAIQQNLETLKLLHDPSPTHTYVSVSLGLSCTTQNPQFSTPEELVEWADQALYQAKEGGRNGYAILQSLSGQTPGASSDSDRMAC